MESYFRYRSNFTSEMPNNIMITGMHPVIKMRYDIAWFKKYVSHLCIIFKAISTHTNISFVLQV